MQCYGCRLGFVVGVSQMQACGGSLYHAGKPRCEELARARLAAELAAGRSKVAERDGGKGPAGSGQEGGGGATRVYLQSGKKEAQLAHRFSDDRIGMILACLGGQCTELHEERMMCVQGCGRGLHAKACAQVSRARKTMGLFKCIECRAGDMVKHSCATLESVTGVLRKSACQSMLVELTGGA